MDNNFSSTPGVQTPPSGGTPVVAPQAFPQVPPPQMAPEPSGGQIPASAPYSGNPFYLTFGFWALIFFLINIVAISYFWVYPLLSPPLIVEDQPMGNTFTIKSLRVSSPGYLALKTEKEAENNQSFYSLVAHSPLLIPDTYKELVLPREGGESLEEFAARVKPNAIVLVALYEDTNSDGYFDPDVDVNVQQDIFGRKVQKAFILR